MKIYDLETLGKVDGLYDLTQITFELKLDGSIVYLPYTVQRGEEMRIDLVCESIYGNTDYIDILCDVNSIDNPLNIKEGTTILFPANSDNIDLLRFSAGNKSDVVTTLSNPNKSTRKDSNRKKYIDNNSSLPPTVLNESTNQFGINGSDIVLGEGLF
jgi:hypothetical protein